MVKLLYRPYTGSEKEKVMNSLLDGIFTSVRMLSFHFYFVYHIRYHVTERKRKSSYSYLELFCEFLVYVTCDTSN